MGKTCPGLQIITVILLGNLFLAQVSSKNIENGGGGFCFKQIPKKAVLGTCSTDEDCKELLDSNLLRCGSEGECVSQLKVTQDICHKACESSPCGKLCGRNYQGKELSKYCVKSRDHEVGSILATEPKQFFCTCTEPQH